MTFNSRVTRHTESLTVVKNLFTDHGFQVFDYGYETEPDFDPSFDYKKTKTDNEKHKPDLLVVGNGTYFYLEVKSGCNYSVGVSCCLKSILSCLHYYPCYIVSVHPLYTIFHPVCDLLNPTLIYSGRLSNDTSSSFFPQSDVRYCKNDRTDSYIWLNPFSGITIGQLISSL